MRTFRDAKIMAKSLRAELTSRRQIDISHGECLDIVSRQFGHDNWNVMAAKTAELAAISGDGSGGPASAASTTIPLLRIFSVEKAKTFYLDFLGCTLDWGAPTAADGTSFYGQVSRGNTTLHLTESAYDPSPGSTVFIWMQGLDDLQHDLNVKREQISIFGPGIWVPWPEDVPWAGGARTMSIADPFGNTLRFVEPNNQADRKGLASWRLPQPSPAP